MKSSGKTVSGSFEDLSDEEDEKLEMMFCFVLNDVFGGYDMTDPISFEI